MASKRWFSPRNIINRYFLKKEERFSKRRGVKLLVLVPVLGFILILFILGSVYFEQEHSKPDSLSHPSFTVPGAAATGGGGAEKKEPVAGMFGGGSGLFGFSLGGAGGSGGRAGGLLGRAHSANQVIRRGAGGNDPGAQLSMGQGIAVKLLNAILSTDSTSPVIAEVLDDVYIHGMLSIPASTRAIGSAHYDESSRRIQIKFGTLVYPEGDQHTIQALGMMPDGSAGLDGDYHSGEFKRQSGRFLGHFIAGMASGMKERKSTGSFGMAYEPGSLKNGLLNGVSLSAEDQAKSLTSDLNSSKPTMTLPSGQHFILYFEREYIP